MWRSACVFIIVFLYGQCSEKYVLCNFVLLTTQLVFEKNQKVSGNLTNFSWLFQRGLSGKIPIEFEGYIMFLLYALGFWIEGFARLLRRNETTYLNYGKVMVINTGPPPTYWDWRDRDLVSPVKDQRDCNACWAFSAVASIESHINIYRDKKITLSEQFLIDCQNNSPGCSSGSVLKTFSHIVSDIGGVLSNNDYYEYSARKRECRWSGKPSVVPVVGYRRVFPNEDDIAKAIFHFGPVSAAINSASMAKYTHGIDQPTKEACPPDELNHAVLIVGYSVYVSKDRKESIPYWIIKNSFGVEWGDKGFYYLERGRNACGIATDVSFPFVQ